MYKLFPYTVILLNLRTKYNYICVPRSTPPSPEYPVNRPPNTAYLKGGGSFILGFPCRGTAFDTWTIAKRENDLPSPVIRRYDI